MSDQLKEHDLPFEDTFLHCYEAGSGFPLIFMHGSGAGCSTLSNFRRVLGKLSSQYHVLAADLLGFGWSGRKTTPPLFDIEAWVRQVGRLVDHLGAASVGLVGHSLSGPIVLKAAARDPRVAGVVTTGTMGAPATRVRGGPRWTFPEDRATVRANVERTMFDASEASEDEVDRRMQVLRQNGHREHFQAMFGGDRDALLDAAALTPAELSRIECPVALMHGRHDRSFSPDETSMWLGDQLTAADVHVLSRCAHSVAHERADTFMAVVRSMFRP